MGAGMRNQNPRKPRKQQHKPQRLHGPSCGQPTHWAGFSQARRPTKAKPPCRYPCPYLSVLTCQQAPSLWRTADASGARSSQAFNPQIFHGPAPRTLQPAAAKCMPWPTANAPVPEDLVEGPALLPNPCVGRAPRGLLCCTRTRCLLLLLLLSR